MAVEPIPHYADDICQCDVEKVLWNGALLCVICDNRDDSAATWFVDLAETSGP